MPPVTFVALAAAIVLGTLAASPLAPDLRIVVALGVVALGARIAYGREPAVFRALLVVALVVGVLNALLRGNTLPNPYELRTARYTATVLERTLEADGSSAVTLALDGGVTASARLRGAVPSPGTRVRVRGRLASFDRARNPGEPDSASLERMRGIDAQLESAAILQRLGSVGSPRVWLARAHEWAHAQLQARLGEPDASVVAGELWGERAALAPDLRAEFQETGTVHVLVTAGLHLGAVAALVVALLALAGWPRTLTCMLAALCIWAFVWWSGAQLPATRAATMATFALAARACGRATLSWSALAAAAVAIALASPASVATPSFALSFSCVGAIAACATPLEGWIDRLTALPDRAREALVLTLATQLGTWPIGAAVFLQFAPYALLANLAVVPCVTLTMALGAATLLCAGFPPLAQAFANLLTWPLAWTLGSVHVLASLPAAKLPMTPAPAWCIATYDATVLIGAWLWQRGARTSACGLALLAVVLVLWPPRALDPRLRITVLDVGQADAIVVQTPRGHALLVDAGGRLERGPQSDASSAEAIGTRIVVPFLLRHGVHAIDAIVLSHPHGDHAGGVAPVLRALRVGELADGGQRYGGHAYHDALDVAHVEGVPIDEPRVGATWHTDDGVAFDFVGPSLPFIGGRNAINDNSIAFVLQYRNFRMLFTGDAGADAEARFLREGVDLHADVLKVGHHGSAYSSTPAFMAAVHPRYAVISVGRHNLFGHPAQSTIATLRRFGARVYRTDQNGAVTILTNGTTVTIDSMLP